MAFKAASFVARRKPLSLVASTFLATSMAPAFAASAAWVDTAPQHFTPASSLGAVPVASQKPMRVLVSLKLQNQSLMQSTVKNLYTPGSPQFHQFLTPAQTIEEFSPSTAQVQSVTAYLQSMGFQNITVSKGRTLVTADGTAAIAQKAFNTSIVQFQKNGKTVFSNTNGASVPASLGSIVQAVNGLQNAVQMDTALQQQRKHQAALAAQRKNPLIDIAALVPKVTPGHGTSDTTVGPIDIIGGYPPTAWDIAYDAGTSFDGSSETIAISTYGSDDAQVITDLRQMEKTNGYSYVPVEVRITTPLSKTQDVSGDDEWDLDSQSSTAIAGNVKKLIFYTVDTSIDLVSEYTAFADEGDAIAGNMSYGSCDALNAVTSSSAVGLLPAISASDPEFMRASMEGLTWHASTGDDGGSCSPVNAEGAPDGGIPGGANYPATSPYVVGVGGTSLFTDANYNRVEEIAWTSGGGGISAVEQAPTWQTSSGAVPSAIAGGATSLKGVPDISMNAGFYVPAAVVEEGAATVVGGATENVVGTSLSSPLATGAWARFSNAHCEGLGFAAPAYYALDTTTGPLSTATGLNDITVGDNGTYTATTGWDYTTGFGSLDLTMVNTALGTPPSGCAPSTSVPTAVLSSNITSGNAQLTVTFDGSKSSDSKGNPLDYYVIDYGDGSPIVFQTPDSTTTPSQFTHTYEYPGTYQATLQVRNSFGTASTTSAPDVITVTGTPASCGNPGALIVPTFTFAGEEGMDAFAGADMLTAVYFQEPAADSGQLVVTLNVVDLSTVYPALRWAVYFNIPEDTTNQYYIDMDTGSGTPAYTYGIHSTVPVAGVSDYTVMGTLDATSTNNGAKPGTITLVLDESALKLQVGDTLTNIEAVVRTSSPNDPTGTVPAGSGLTQDSGGANVNYTLVGNTLCAADVGATTGTSTGGTSTGGTSTGGTSTGSASTGGTSTGGTSTGSGTSTTGGSSTGGTSTTGGTGSGGSSSGTSTGGSGTSTTGGSSSGGASTGSGSTSSGTSGGTNVTGTTSPNGTSGSFGLGLIPLFGLAAVRRKRRQK